MHVPSREIAMGKRHAANAHARLECRPKACFGDRHVAA
jgi:hypothetical protein